ncbi:MAG: hypothetical protein ACI9VR_002783 [Cognaticolwellia sp.]|jgi:hypothetical protein
MTLPTPRRRRPRRPTALMYLAAATIAGALCCGVPSLFWSYEPPLETLVDKDPAVEAVLREAEGMYPDPKQPFEDYVAHAQARVDRGLDLAGAAASARKALVLRPDSPQAAALLVQVSGASAGEAGVDLGQAAAILRALEVQGELQGDQLLLTQGHLALGHEDLVGARTALQGLHEPSWNSKRLALELAMREGRLAKAEVLAEEFRQGFEADASTCRVGLELAIARGQLYKAEDLVNECLAEGVQDPRLNGRLAQLADWTGRPAVAASRYAAAGLGVEAVAVQWQEGILGLAQARAQLSGDSLGERRQRTWMALHEGDAAAALIESEGLRGPTRAAALLRTGAAPERVQEALDGQDSASHVIAALAFRGTPKELGHWQAAVSPWPADPDVLRAWLLAGGEGTRDAALEHLSTLQPGVVLRARRVPDRMLPLWVLLPAQMELADCRGSDPCRVLMGDLEGLQDPVYRALLAVDLGELREAKMILTQVPAIERSTAWILAKAELDLANNKATAAQSAVIPLLQSPGAKRILAQAVAQRGGVGTALETLGGLLQDLPLDQYVWEICWKISAAQAQPDLDSAPPAQ